MHHRSGPYLEPTKIHPNSLPAKTETFLRVASRARAQKISSGQLSLPSVILAPFGYITGNTPASPMISNTLNSGPSLLSGTATPVDHQLLTVDALPPSTNRRVPTGNRRRSESGARRTPAVRSPAGEAEAPWHGTGPRTFQARPLPPSVAVAYHNASCEGAPNSVVALSERSSSCTAPSAKEAAAAMGTTGSRRYDAFAGPMWTVLLAIAVRCGAASLSGSPVLGLALYCGALLLLTSTPMLKGVREGGRRGRAALCRTI